MAGANPLGIGSGHDWDYLCCHHFRRAVPALAHGGGGSITPDVRRSQGQAGVRTSRGARGTGEGPSLRGRAQDRKGTIEPVRVPGLPSSSDSRWSCYAACGREVVRHLQLAKDNHPNGSE